MNISTLIAVSINLLAVLVCGGFGIYALSKDCIGTFVFEMFLVTINLVSLIYNVSKLIN